MEQITQLRGEYHFDRNAYVVGGEPAIFHCHHYNCFLQAVIKDTSSYIEATDEILIGSAQEIAYSQFSKSFVKGMSIEERKEMIEDYFCFAGFGKLDLSSLHEDGGTIETDSDHYGIGWQAKFGKSKEPVSFFTAGFIAGALEAAYDLSLGTFATKQTTCLAMGDELSTFEISTGNPILDLTASQGEGQYGAYTLHNPKDTGVDYSAVREALTNMPIEGHPDSGIIDAFDVLLTRHYANYYCNISYKLLKELESKMGNKGTDIAVKLLVESGHVCAFNTFGGIMQSNEWNGMIKPMLKSADDWIHGITAVVNAFGWGFWEIVEFIPNEFLKVKITNGYESNSFLKRYGKSQIPISFLATGGTAGLMNLLYVLDLPKVTPITLDEDLYKKIHLDKGFFVSEQVKCRAMGDEYDLFEVRKRN